MSTVQQWNGNIHTLPWVESRVGDSKQPRPQGAFPWLWERPQSQGKAPWGRGWIQNW